MEVKTECQWSKCLLTWASCTPRSALSGGNPWKVATLPCVGAAPTLVLPFGFRCVWCLSLRRFERGSWDSYPLCAHCSLQYLWNSLGRFFRPISQVTVLVSEMHCSLLREINLPLAVLRMVRQKQLRVLKFSMMLIFKSLLNWKTALSW